MGGSIDLRAGTAAAFAMLAGLHYRDRTGLGQFVDASSREAIAMHMGEEFLRVSCWATTASAGQRPPRLGAARCLPLRRNARDQRRVWLR